MKRDYYDVLQVDRSADEATLKKSFRRLAMEFHPDRNSSPEAADRFREVQEAYSVLSDPERRSLYDRFGHEGLRQSGFDPFGQDIFSGFQSIFEDFFGGFSSNQETKGADLLYRLELSFREAVLGTTKSVEIDRHELCSTCEGSGCAKGTRPETCSLCQGRGKVMRNQGFFVISQTCSQCRGQGQIIRKPCGDCRGNGVVRKSTTLDVHIPAGVDTGIRLRLTGEGDLPPSGKRRGDLYVEVHVQSDEVFERDGNDLLAQVHIPFPTAVFGGEVEVPLIEGTTTLKIPKKMKAPYRAVLKGEGVKDLKKNKRGDLIVEVHIETPDELSAEATSLLKQLESELSQPIKPTSKKKKKILLWLTIELLQSLSRLFESLQHARIDPLRKN